MFWGIIAAVLVLFSTIACNSSVIPTRGSLNVAEAFSPTAVPDSAKNAATATSTPSPSPSPTPTSSPTAVPTQAKSAAVSSLPLAPLIVRGDASKRQLALTFDAGAAAGSSAEVLDILRRYGIRSTFFLTGSWAEQNPALVRRIAAEGHRVANHSYSHPDMTKVSDETIVSELAKTEEIVRRIVGATTKPYFRPPFGAYDSRLLRILGREGYKAIYWTLDSTDWRDDSTAESVRQFVVSKAGPGYIVVHHLSSEKTAKALPAIISELRAKGIEIVNLPDLLGD